MPLCAEDLQVFEQALSASRCEPLREARILITGGTGFIGCWLLEALLWANRRHALGLSLTVLTRDAGRFQHKASHLAADHAVTLLIGDLVSLADHHASYDFVVHAATDVVGEDTDPLKAFDLIVEGTRQVADLVQRAAARRLLYLSSGAVYGRQPVDCPQVSESYAGAPDVADLKAAYGHAKRVSEWLLGVTATRGDFEVTCARIFAVIGPYMPLNGHFAAGNFIADALQGRKIQITGDGKPLRSYIYGADLAVWLVSMLARPGELRAYNVGSPVAMSIADLAAAVDEVATSGQVTPRDFQPEEGVPRYVPDTGSAQADFGLRIFTPFHEAVRRTYAWFFQRRD
ncbi:NAD-dependent epimerase/dehydratase family protein [Achromobacter denitrificans]|nr:NAD-dependent epimerase/dehydratase family protein [Achromobacter denitrificans]MDF3942663.1 NAD-dependent epimerase/dehydratase family protein [Achromobacter denitrificans]